MCIFHVFFPIYISFLMFWLLWIWSLEIVWNREILIVFYSVHNSYKLWSGCQPKLFEVICILSDTVLDYVVKLLCY